MGEIIPIYNRIADKADEYGRHEEELPDLVFDRDIKHILHGKHGKHVNFGIEKDR